MKNFEIKVKGMVCEGCENRLKNALSKLEEIKNVKADHNSGIVSILLNEELTEDLKLKIKKIIEDLDFEIG